MMTSVTGQCKCPVTESLFRREKIKMKYEKPKWELIVLEMDDIVHTSPTSLTPTVGEGTGWTDQAP